MLFNHESMKELDVFASRMSLIILSWMAGGWRYPQNVSDGLTGLG